MALIDTTLTRAEHALLSSDEEKLLREAVAGIAHGFGHDYFYVAEHSLGLPKSY
jgi:hypothetical protein